MQQLSEKRTVMTQQKHNGWTMVVVLGVGITLGAGAMAWMARSLTSQVTTRDHEPRYDQRFTQLEQAVTTLTQSLERIGTPGTPPEPTYAADGASNTAAQQALATMIRAELHQALAQWTPESRQAREDEIVATQILNSPENKAAYQSAADVVRTAVAAKRWTDDDRRVLNDALDQLTKEQFLEVMEQLLPAINRGEITVETTGPLF